MRFLLKRLVDTPKNKSITAASTSTGKAWGQHCGTTCGCVLRIETKLSDEHTTANASPTIIEASYHAKRVLAAPIKSSDRNGIYLQPLTTQHSSNSAQPILSSCTCPALHKLATQTVNYLPGKTLAQIRNEIVESVTSARTSVAFRHTVLRENILPTISEETSKKALGIENRLAKKKNRTTTASDGAYDNIMNSIHKYGHCYDLVEDSLLSMIHERMPVSRNYNEADFYSITMGSYFPLYDGKSIGMMHHDRVSRQKKPGLSSVHEASDWQRRESPSSLFLFGDDTIHNNNTMSGMIMEHIESWLVGTGDNKKDTQREESIEDAATGESYRRNAYLRLLDMYGQEFEDDISSQKEDRDWAKDDWLDYVDQTSLGNTA